MANSAMIHARIDAETKEEVKNVLDTLGLNMSEAIVLFFRQVALRKGIPFDISIPNDATASTLRKSKRGKELHEVSDVRHLMRELSD